MIDRSRRRVLQWAGSAAACACVSGPLFAASAPPQSTALTPRLDLLSADGSNFLVAHAGAQLLLVDSGPASSADSVRRLLDKSYPKSRIGLLFNTHWHREQTGLNEFVGRQGGVICAHENTRLWLATEVYIPWQDRTYGPLPAKALPTRTFYTSDQTSFGGMDVRYGRLPSAHTDGDIFVHFPSEDVIAVGGAAVLGSWPLMDYSTGGWLGGVVDASKLLVSMMGEETRVVPASGPVMRKKDMQALAAMAGDLRDRIVAQIKNGMGVEDMLAARITKDYESRLGDPEFFVASAYRGLWGHIRELGIA